MNLLNRLGELLGVRTDEVECVLREDTSRARSTVRMQRRGFLGAAAAVAAAPFVPKTFWAATDQVYRLPEVGELTSVFWIRKRVHQPLLDELVLVTRWPVIEHTFDGLFARDVQ